MTSRLTPEKIENLLRGLDGLRVYAPTEQVQCIEVPLEYRGSPVFAYFYNGRFSKTFFAKIVSTPAGCLEALTAPIGFFIFYTGDDEEFRKSFRLKVDALIKLNSSRRE